MRNPVLGGLLALVITSSTVFTSVFAQDSTPTLRDNRPNNYTVVKGDTLWDISSRFLKDAWRWKEIWQGNSQISNPDLIYPGDTIKLVFVDGQPQLVINDQANQAADNKSTVTINKNTTLPTVKLSPKIRVSAIDTAIPNIPLNQINNFLLRNRVVEPNTLIEAAHVVAGQEERVILSAGDRIYARGDFSNGTSTYGLYRTGQDYIDPETKEVLGLQAIDIGAANLISAKDDLGTLIITRSSSEIRVDNRLLPIEQRNITATFLPEPPSTQVEGMIMNVETGVSQAGKLDIIAINLGSRDSIKQGNVLGIFKRGRTINDYNAKQNTAREIILPDERAGMVMVFQVFEKMSLAIVLEADRGVVLKDFVRTP